MTRKRLPVFLFCCSLCVCASSLTQTNPLNLQQTCRPLAPILCTRLRRDSGDDRTCQSLGTRTSGPNWTQTRERIGLLVPLSARLRSSQSFNSVPRPLARSLARQNSCKFARAKLVRRATAAKKHNRPKTQCARSLSCAQFDSASSILFARPPARPAEIGSDSAAAD